MNICNVPGNDKGGGSGICQKKRATRALISVQADLYVMQEWEVTAEDMRSQNVSAMKDSLKT